MESQQQEGAASNAFNLAQSSGRRSPAAAETGGNNKKDGANLNGDTMQQSMPQERVNSGPRNALHQWSVLVHDRHLRQQLQEDDIELEIVRKRFEEGHSISRHGRPHTWRQKMLHYVHSRPLQILIAALILIDVGLLIAEIIVEMDEAETRVLTRDEQLRFLGDFVLIGLDRPLGGQIARAGCLKPMQHITESDGPAGGFNPFERVDDKEAEEQLKRLVLGIKRVRRDVAARNASAALLCIPSNLTLEQCAAIPPPHVSCPNAPSLSSGHAAGVSVPVPVQSPQQKQQQQPHHRRRRRSSGGADSPEPGIVPTKCPQCASEREESLRHRQHILHILSKIFNYLSISILFIFLVELILKLICTPFHEFIKNAIEVADAVVVVLSFVLDLLTLLIPNLASSTTLIILFLFWRIVRLVNGLMVEEKQRYEARIEIFKAQNEWYKDQLEELLAEKILLETKEMHLRALCRNLGATDNNFSSLDDHVKSHQLKARSACPRHGVVAGAGPGAGGRVRVSTRVFLHGEQPECTCAGAMRRNTSGVQMLANLVRSTVPAAHLPVVDLSPPPAPVPPLTKPPASAQPLSEEETPFISRS